MFCYRVYGQQLLSELSFPELRDGQSGAARWTLRLGGEVEPTAVPDTSPLGHQVIYPGCSARLYARADGWRIVVDDTGVFDLAAGGREITWSPFPGSTLDFGRAHLLGRVLSTAMHFDGSLVLHGSAVSFPAGAIVFLAPKHTGKSTLALALTLGGARLVSDDTITVDLSGQSTPAVWPGVHSLRLLPDAVEHLRTPSLDQRRDGKFLVNDLAPAELEQRVRPLLAVYLLAAAESISGGQAIARRLMSPPLAAAALVGQGKISEMLGPAEAPVLLRRAAVVASRVPIYGLAVLQDLHRLSEVTSQLADWHATLPAEPR